jgi:hypothetical protein
LKLFPIFGIVKSKEFFMESLAMKKFTRAPGKAREFIRRNHAVELTCRGKPSFVVFDVTDKDSNELARLFAGIEGLRFLKETQSFSVKTGGDKISMEDINAEIEAYRKEKRNA